MHKYQERLRPSVWFFLVLFLIIPAIIVLFSAYNLVWIGLGTGLVVYLVTAGLAYSFSPKLSIDEEWFQAGEARIERKYLANPEVFYDEEAFLERGRHLNLKAYYLIRSGINPVIKLENIDPEDEVPYWLISTRKPEVIQTFFKSPSEQQ